MPRPNCHSPASREAQNCAPPGVLPRLPKGRRITNPLYLALTKIGPKPRPASQIVAALRTVSDIISRYSTSKRSKAITSFLAADSLFDGSGNSTRLAENLLSKVKQTEHVIFLNLLLFATGHTCVEVRINRDDRSGHTSGFSIDGWAPYNGEHRVD